MVDILYENFFVFKNFFKGKIFWIEYNGKKIVDLNFCILFLNEEFKVVLDDKFSKLEKVVFYVFKIMVEENIYW